MDMPGIIYTYSYRTGRIRGKIGTIMMAIMIHLLLIWMETESMTFNMLRHVQTFHAYSTFWRVS
ncbi:hypothetical protein BHU09_09670 [Tannerella sp. oral taxon 808]|nr:hypothetical protein BHU09_09670 [Tannerella sp. oral taxon 808]